MNKTLGKNERLVRDGYTDLRATDGTPLQNVRTYRIVNVQDADPEKVEPLAGDEHLVLQGMEAHRDEDGAFLDPIPIYRKVKKSEIDRKTGLIQQDKDNCDALVVGTMVEIFGRCMEEAKALDRQSARQGK